MPELLEELGWTGGECITDARAFVHYFRTTRDGRIAFGWGGGRLAAGARLGGEIEVDPEVATETHAHLVEMFPQLEGRAITHAWGGPIDVSPAICRRSGRSTDAPVHYAFGFTGNGVGPSPPRRPRPRGAGERPVDRPRVRRPGARPRARRAARIRGRNARPPCLFT